MIKSGKTSRLESFKDQSLKTGIFLIDLLHAINPGCINYEFVHSPAESGNSPPTDKKTPTKI